MLKFLPGTTIMLVLALALTCQATAQDTPNATPAPQTFTLNLPAGVSLISTPLDTGQVWARDTFQGLPGQYPLFYGWNPAIQDWVSGDQVPALLGGGYWVYLPTPATLVVQGQPYSPSTAVSKHIDPGWHLFGVPFPEGIGWKDFHLYVSGNPIGLETAVQMGWIDPNVITTKGSVAQYQTPGQPLLPGVAYWVRTLVPMELRAERQAPVPENATLNAPLAPAQLSLSPNAQESSGGESTSTKVMGWLGAISKFLVDVFKGAVQLSEGHVAAAAFEFSAGTFGLVEYGIGKAEPAPVDKLQQVDDKLSALITSASQISGQLTQVASNITGLQAYMVNSTKMQIPLSNSDTWLGTYYTNRATTAGSREWARYALAGCDTSLPSCTKQVTADSYKTFTNSYIKHPGQLTSALDDFPYWWANSVIGGQFTGVAPYAANGSTAAEVVVQIYNGLMDGENPLQNYMQYVFTKSGCTLDVSDSGCDLFGQVYLPLETYFLRAVSAQAQLAAAVTESYEVLAAKNPGVPAGAIGPYDASAKGYMAGVNQYINQEAEVFLRVVEQLALYRAADGTKDWNNFGSSDAGQLLARADFIVMQLAGANYHTNPPSGYINPPWPASGAVGRIFYVDGEPSLTTGGRSRTVCPSASTVANPDDPYCGVSAFTVTQLVEDPSSMRKLTGDWPYLLWALDAKNIVVGTPTKQWTVVRLKPASLANGHYVANSAYLAHLGTSLVVAPYDSTYTNPPAAGTLAPINFGSLNAIEGTIGKFALQLAEPGLFSPWHKSGTGSTQEIQFSAAYNDLIDAPGAAYLHANYVPFAAHTDWNSSVSMKWSNVAGIQLADTPAASAFYAAFPKQHLHWVSSVNANLTGKVTSQMTCLNGTGAGGTWYYSALGLNLDLVDSKLKTVGSAATTNKICAGKKDSTGATGFNACSFSGTANQNLDTPSLSLALGSTYTFRVNFESQVEPYDGRPGGCESFRSSVSPSSLSWIVNAPTLTLTK